ncbi:cytoplasmic protein [Ureibacillus composti]
MNTEGDKSGKSISTGTPFSLHRKELEKDKICGCFYCEEIYHPTNITEWIDDGNTALCPYCGIDAVIGESSGYPITEQFLKEMYMEWF